MINILLDDWWGLFNELVEKKFVKGVEEKLALDECVDVWYNLYAWMYAPQNPDDPDETAKVRLGFNVDSADKSLHERLCKDIEKKCTNVTRGEDVDFNITLDSDTEQALRLAIIKHIADENDLDIINEELGTNFKEAV
jgi:hypothetical protein